MTLSSPGTASGKSLRNRTKARELALKFLYQVDLRGIETLQELDEFLAVGSHAEEIVGFARDLVHGVTKMKDEIDVQIQDVARNWDLHRMAAIDRNVLRLAVFEMNRRDDIPDKVSINEAIDLGKKYSTKSSGAFINGILDRIRVNSGDESQPKDPSDSPAEEEETEAEIERT